MIVINNPVVGSTKPPQNNFMMHAAASASPGAFSGNDSQHNNTRQSINSKQKSLYRMTKKWKSFEENRQTILIAKTYINTKN